MTKSTIINRFMKDRIAVHFPEFHLFRRRHLLKICRPLLHGIVIESPGPGEYFYVTCFVQFLTERDDTFNMGFGERVPRCDGSGQSFWVEPSDEESVLLNSLRQSSFSPFNLDPTCRNVLKLAEGFEHGPHTFFGLATCAILENDVNLALELLERSRERTGSPVYEWRQKLLAEIEELESGLNNTQATQIKLMRWVEESIRMLGLQTYG